MSNPDHRHPRDLTDRQILEAIYRRIDGLATMLGGPVRTALDLDEDINYAVSAWTPTPPPERIEP